MKEEHRCSRTPVLMSLCLAYVLYLGIVRGSWMEELIKCHILCSPRSCQPSNNSANPCHKYGWHTRKCSMQVNDWGKKHLHSPFPYIHSCKQPQRISAKTTTDHTTHYLIFYPASKISDHMAACSLWGHIGQFWIGNLGKFGRKHGLGDIVKGC